MGTNSIERAIKCSIDHRVATGVPLDPHGLIAIAADMRALQGLSAGLDQQLVARHTKDSFRTIVSHRDRELARPHWGDAIRAGAAMFRSSGAAVHGYAVVMECCVLSGGERFPTEETLDEEIARWRGRGQPLREHPDAVEMVCVQINGSVAQVYDARTGRYLPPRRPWPAGRAAQPPKRG